MLVVGGVSLLAVGGWLYSASAPTQHPVSLRFYAYVGDERLTLNELRYNNPGGKGVYKVRDFQFFISNIRLTGPSANYTVEDSYHLVRFDGENPYAEIALPVLNIADYDTIHWGIGVDPKANGTIKIAGDLDPNNRMAWNWQVGYKFILLEGRLDEGDELVPLVYHVGFDENYTQQTLPFAQVATEDTGHVVRFKVDINALFSGGEPFDMAAIPSVKFDPDDARRIARGFEDLVSLDEQ